MSNFVALILNDEDTNRNAKVALSRIVDTKKFQTFLSVYEMVEVSHRNNTAFSRVLLTEDALGQGTGIVGPDTGRGVDPRVDALYSLNDYIDGGYSDTEVVMIISSGSSSGIHKAFTSILDIPGATPAILDKISIPTLKSLVNDPVTNVRASYYELDKNVVESSVSNADTSPHPPAANQGTVKKGFLGRLLKGDSSGSQTTGDPREQAEPEPSFDDVASDVIPEDDFDDFDDFADSSETGMLEEEEFDSEYEESDDYEELPPELELGSMYDEGEYVSADSMPSYAADEYVSADELPNNGWVHDDENSKPWNSSELESDPENPPVVSDEPRLPAAPWSAEGTVAPEDFRPVLKDRIIIVTGSRGTGVTEEAVIRALESVDMGRVLYIDFDFEKAGVVGRLEKPAIFSKGSHYITSGNPYDEDGLDVLSNGFKSYTEENIKSWADWVNDPSNYANYFKVIIDCPVHNLKLLEDIAKQCKTLFMVPANPTGLIEYARYTADKGTVPDSLCVALSGNSIAYASQRDDNYVEDLAGLRKNYIPNRLNWLDILV